MSVFIYFSFKSVYLMFELSHGHKKKKKIAINFDRLYASQN